MSNQPSTMETLRSAAASATQNVAETLDPSRDQSSDNKMSDSKEDVQGSSSDKSYKQQLDEAARTHTSAGEENKKETFIEKGTRQH